MNKINKVITVLLCCSVMAMGLDSVVLAAESKAQTAAESLYKLGLFKGVGEDADGKPVFDLDREANRNEAITMLVRLLGKEKEATEAKWEIPFTDVAEWAKPYVGYAYNKGLTKGVSATEFAGTDKITAVQYITFIVRALGYKDDVDFTWDKVNELSDKIKLTDGSYTADTKIFNRSDMAIISERSLDCTIKTGKTLRAFLTSQGVLKNEASPGGSTLNGGNTTGGSSSNGGSSSSGDGGNSSSSSSGDGNNSSSSNNGNGTQEAPPLIIPWEEGGKNPNEYTWAEYEALNGEQQMEFFHWFESPEAFDSWMKAVNPQGEEQEGTTVIPWEEGGKNPDEYTWQEYEALNSRQQIAFFHWFESADAFDSWMERVNPQGEEQEEPAALPWEEGGKTPDEYTWEEYEALSGEQQMAFFHWFESPEAFDEWMKAANSQGDTMPWEEGGKNPDEYTWEEYEALSGEQQMAFFHWFGSSDEFDSWMESVNPQGGSAEVAPWEEGGKYPDEYTWEEYEALSGELQMAFFHWFGSSDEFDSWMESVNPQGGSAEVAPWEEGGKNPDEYTWEEYEALSGELQMAFFNWFESIEAFDTWMMSVQP